MQAVQMTLDSEDLQGQGEQILVVDDEPAMTDFLGEFLEDYGYKVSRVNSAEEALQLLEKSVKISVVATDIKMPKMDGIQLAARLREKYPHLPIIGISGKVNVSKFREQHQEKFLTIIQKPFLYQEVLEAIHRAIGLQS